MVKLKLEVMYKIRFFCRVEKLYNIIFFFIGNGMFFKFTDMDKDGCGSWMIVLFFCKN